MEAGRTISARSFALAKIEQVQSQVRRHRTHIAIRYGIATAVVLVLLGGLGIWWFFSDDAPPEVDLAEASRAWDRTAGQLDQHQTAYNIDEGIHSPAKARVLGPGYANSVERTTDAQYSLHHALQHQQQELSRHLSGPALRIGR